ncbi:acyltransferase [Pseudomonas sp. FP2196]|uniref:acyltransferase family protein n=1 Tax=Pseudomonas sp. FP2196 TaxID=2954086 RepID=UPI002732979C|nr:acyltransferase [Pseudomonas sp. FP2196]WLH34084.1 acyltransferase [Pseudomonas sp. FP2196]
MSGRFSGADGIRGLACLMVLCAHIPGFFFPQIAGYFSGTGKYGVWLFFVLSAFLLTSKFARNGFSVTEILGYAVGRFLRIVPLFLLVVVFYWYFNVAGITTSEDVVNAMAFRQGYSHLWTIPVEFKFYFFLPFIAFAFIVVERRCGAVAVAIFALSLMVIHQLSWPYWLTPENSISTHWYLPSFIFGCYAAVSIEGVGKWLTPRMATGFAVAVIIALLALSPGGRNILFAMPLDGWLMNKFIYLSFLWMVFILALANGQGRIGGLMQSFALRKLGAWSYSIYLIHWIFYQKLSLLHKGGLYAMLAFVGAIMAGAAMYVFIESPIERFRHSLQGKLKKMWPVAA